MISGLKFCNEEKCKLQLCKMELTGCIHYSLIFLCDYTTQQHNFLQITFIIRHLSVSESYALKMTSWQLIYMVP